MILVCATGSCVILWNDGRLLTEWGSTMFKKNWAHFYFPKTKSHSWNFTSNPVITLHLCSWMDLATYWWESTIVHLITYLFPSSASLPLSLSSIAETIINYPYPCYPSLNLLPSSRSIQQSGSLWLLGGHPTPPSLSVKPALRDWQLHVQINNNLQTV